MSNTICLWYDKEPRLPRASMLQPFPTARLVPCTNAPSAYPGGKEGDC